MERYIEAGTWAQELEKRDSPLTARLLAACQTSTLTDDRRSQYRQTIARFVELFGPDRPVAIVRSPGRLNVLGMHIDHRGGFVNPMALTQEVVLVFSPAADDLIDVENLNSAFGRRTFRVADVKPPQPLPDLDSWLDWTQGLHTRRAERGVTSDWAHKLAGPCAYLAGVLAPDRELKGFCGVMTGNIMQRVGLSSSSAVVVATMLAATTVNGIEIDMRQQVERCGIAEWYVGTRGGFGDHAAILCGRAGQLLRVRTVPELVVAGYTPFPQEYRLLVFHSGFAADKTGGAGDTFNERTATYDLAEMLAERHLQEQHPELWKELGEARRHLPNPKPMHLGDIAERLSAAEVYALLNTIPERADRDTLRRLLPDRHEDLRRQFATHREPPEGYPLRFVLLYGIAECARAERGGDFLAAGDVVGFGRLMTVSHDGDRVSGLSEKLHRLKTQLDTSLPLWEQPGDYACSTKEVDAMVDVALGTGALGAQISGAGLGGSVMALVHEDHKIALVRAMHEHYYRANDIEPRYLEAVPSAGATVV